MEEAWDEGGAGNAASMTANIVYMYSSYHTIMCPWEQMCETEKDP